MGVTDTPSAQLCLLSKSVLALVELSQTVSAAAMHSQDLLPVPREVHALGDCIDGGAKAELSGCAVGGCRVELRDGASRGNR
eukprot:1235537-Pyramimonas_sp.AAC.1